MSDELKVVPQSTDMVAVMESYFLPFREQAADWMEKAKAISVTDESQVAEMAAAKAARLALRKIRTGAEAKHKELKEESLKTGQMLDKIKRELVGMIEPIEAVLKEKEEFAEVQEEKRKIALRDERTKLLHPYFGSETQHMQLGDMNQSVFESLLAGAKAAKKEKEEAAAEEARVKAETDRKREEEDRKVREENERLKADRSKLEARVRLITPFGMIWNEVSQSYIKDDLSISLFEIKNDSDDSFAEKCLAISSELTKRREKEETANKRKEEQLKKERAERKRLEEEAAAKQAEEEAAKKKKLAEERKARNAPDKVKLIAAAAQIVAIQFLPVSSDEAKKIVEDAKALLAKVVSFINSKSEGL